MSPIFIFSLPRAGSTLLQRLLAAHRNVRTVSEPWILLPFLYALRDKGVYAEYEHHGAVQAIEDFYTEMPNGLADYREEIRKCTLALYEKASRNADGMAEDDQVTSLSGPVYFLDKTPRYHLIIKDIVELFPEGKFIFLWRNPLSVAASMIETFSAGEWNLDIYKIDLFTGLRNMMEAAECYKDRAISIQFETLLCDPTSECDRLFSYLNLPFDPKLLAGFKGVRLEGRKGDPTGRIQYSSIDKEPLEKWKLTLSNPVRKAWAKSYLKWIGKDQLAFMGYDLDGLLQSVNDTPLKLTHTLSDLQRIIYGEFYNTLEFRLMKNKVENILDPSKNHRHT